MSINQHPSLETLPIEILYRICDNLDVATVFLSFRNICRRLRLVIINYNNYTLDLRFILQSNFRLVGRLINPHQIKSLILSNQNVNFDQIILFNSIFDVKQLSNIRCLTLISIDEGRLSSILKRINISSLISFSVEIKESNKYDHHMTAAYITSIFIRAKLDKLMLNIPRDRIKDIEWPDNYTIKHLEIRTILDSYQLNIIFCRLPQLKTLIIDFYSINYIRKTNLVFYTQLTSLSLRKIDMTVNDVSLILRLTPSLTYLQLIGIVKILDGHWWKQFIQTNLPLLKKFEFYFIQYHNDKMNYPNIESIVESFQTSFWLEEKKWFVTCEYNINLSKKIILYSIPMNMSLSNSLIESTKLSISTCDVKSNKNLSIVVKNNKIAFNFAQLTFNDIEQQRQITTNHPLLHTKTILAVLFGTDRSINWIPFISIFISLSTITCITLGGIIIMKANSHIIADIKILLQQACNCSLFIISVKPLLSTTDKWLLTANDICSMIPIHIQNLRVPIRDINEVIIVLEQLKHLSSVSFVFQYEPCLDQFHEWFQSKKQSFTYQIESYVLYVWFKHNNNNSSNELEVNNKRIKLSNDHDHKQILQ